MTEYRYTLLPPFAQEGKQMKVRVTEMVKITQDIEVENVEQVRSDWQEMDPGDRLYYFNELMSVAEAEEIEHTHDVQELNEDGSLKDDDFESGTNHPLHDER